MTDKSRVVEINDYKSESEAWEDKARLGICHRCMTNKRSKGNNELCRDCLDMNYHRLPPEKRWEREECLYGTSLFMVGVACGTLFITILDCFRD